MERRDFMKLSAAGALLAGCGGESVQQPSDSQRQGAVVGEPAAAEDGTAMLTAGGNVVDAIVTAALTAGVVAVPSCGIGGYGGHMTLAFADSGEVVSIDFNSIAPAALTENYFAPGPDGVVEGQVNQWGWLASGVPGTLAGMDLAIQKYGSKTFSDALRPAIRRAREGFPVEAGLARAIDGAKEQFLRDPGAAALFCPGGKPLAEGATYRNPDLASMLETLAAAGSAEPFYRGPIAERIAAQFQKNGGIATVEDFAALRAEVVEPLRMEWRGHELFTAPLTAGGATMFETLSILNALEFSSIDDAFARTHSWLEALRIAWKDRLDLFGDPRFTDVPMDRLLSPEYAQECASRVRKAVEEGKPLDLQIDWIEQVGTIHLSAADAAGNMAALTLTHGGGFGARVVVEGMGLALGHGVSRFDPRPGRANSPGPRKKPLHNMCPTIVRREGKPVLAVGARGGRRIPNSVLSVLLDFCRDGGSVEQAIAAPRLHVEGGLNASLDNAWDAETPEKLASIGYEVAQASVAVASAVGLDAASGEWRAAHR
jgi:gamma-glutamyltranspeptidase/glutathione hydrolase